MHTDFSIKPKFRIIFDFTIKHVLEKRLNSTLLQAVRWGLWPSLSSTPDVAHSKTNDFIFTDVLYQSFMQNSWNQMESLLKGQNCIREQNCRVSTVMEMF